jgi:hypothetical protein
MKWDIWRPWLDLPTCTLKVMHLILNIFLLICSFSRCEYQDSTTSVIGWLMIIQRMVEWELAGETLVFEEILAPSHFIHHKSYMTWPIEQRPAWAISRPNIRWRILRNSIYAYKYLRATEWLGLSRNCRQDTETESSLRSSEETNVVPITSQMNPFHIQAPYYLDINFNIILTSTCSSSR